MELWAKILAPLVVCILLVCIALSLFTMLNREQPGGDKELFIPAGSTGTAGANGLQPLAPYCNRNV